MIFVYPAIFHPNSDGTITVTFPDLECTTQGKDVADAIVMARDALAIYLDTAAMVQQPVSQPSALDIVACDKSEYVTLIDADPEIYERKRKPQAVKRTISLPAWMDEKANAEGLSLSKVMQDALSQRYGIHE